MFRRQNGSRKTRCMWRFVGWGRAARVQGRFELENGGTIWGHGAAVLVHDQAKLDFLAGSTKVRG